MYLHLFTTLPNYRNLLYCQMCVVSLQLCVPEEAVRIKIQNIAVIMITVCYNPIAITHAF